MHPEAKHFMVFVKDTFPTFFINKNVLDVGSGDINGNNRYLFTNCTYNGNDVCEAPNVTVVSPTSQLQFVDEYFDTIVSTECFEHDPEYIESFEKIYKMLKPGGIFAFTCASTGRKEHGTRRTSPSESFGTISRNVNMQDYYKNLTVDDMPRVPEVFSEWKSYYNPSSFDLYFIGIKKIFTKSYEFN